MKKETKRYYIVEYCTPIEIKFNTREEYESKLASMKLYNKRIHSEFIFGNVTTTNNPDGTITALFQRYNRLSPAMTISDLDNFTMGKTQEDLIREYREVGKIKTKEDYLPDINIAYYEDKDEKERENEKVHYDRRIKYIPIMYNEDKNYTNQDFIINTFKYHARNNDYGFFKDLANEFCLHRPAGEEVSNLWQVVDKCEHQGYSNYDMVLAATALYRSVILERERNGVIRRNSDGSYEISRRRLRDVAMFIKYYGIPDDKKVIPTRYNGRFIGKSRNLK